MNLQKYGEFAVIMSQVVLALATLSNDVADPANAPINDYIFIGLVAFIGLAKLFKLKIFKIILTVFLFLGTCNLLNTSFFMYQSENSLTWASGFQLNINFNFIYFLILLFYLGIHYQNIMKYLEKTSKEVDDAKNKPLENYLSKYYNELNDKENTYLENIISTKDRWQKEYVLAAEKILQERNTDPNSPPPIP